MQLVCSYLLVFIKERELTQLALRVIPDVAIGRFVTDGRSWGPFIDIVHSRHTGKELVPRTVHQLGPCLRMAFCESFVIELEQADAFICGIVFDDLVVPNTSVGKLEVGSSEYQPELIARSMEQFKLVKTISAEWARGFGRAVEPLGEKFFFPAVQRGVRHIRFTLVRDEDTYNDAHSYADNDYEDSAPTNTAAALSFLGSPSRRLAKVAELDGDRRVDFTFKLAKVSPQIDSTGFKKYQRGDGRTWLMKDLENRVNVEVKQTDYLVEIHVFTRS